MTEEPKTLKTQKEFEDEQYNYVIIYLKNGDSLVGPAIVHPPVGESLNIEKWIYTQFVVIKEPLRIAAVINPDKFSLSFGKYLNFSDQKHCLIKTDSIQSVNYINERTRDFYEAATTYFKKTMDVAINEEMENYTRILKQKISEDERDKKITAEHKVEKFKQFLAGVFGNNGPTIH